MVGLDLGEDGLDQIAVVNLRVEHVGCRAADARSDEAQAGFVVHGRLVLGEDDQRRAGGVEARVHAGGELDAARQREPDVRVVGHVVRLEGALDFRRDGFRRRNLRESQRERRAAEPLEVLGQAEDFAVVNAQSLPHGVAALHGGVEWADGGLVAVQQLAVDVDDQVAVFLVEFLKHDF